MQSLKPTHLPAQSFVRILKAAVWVSVVSVSAITSAETQSVRGLTWAQPSIAKLARAASSFGSAWAMNSQTISFPQPPTPAYSGTSVTLSASASSGLAVTYKIVSGPATLDGNVLSYLGTGGVTVEADQAGDADYAPAAPVQVNLSVVLLTEPVGTMSPMVTTTVVFLSGGSVSSITALTLGAPNLDFSVAPGGTCAVGGIYTVGQSCSVNFTFSPIRPGERLGGLTLGSSTGGTLAQSYVYGLGEGPQVSFSPGIAKSLGNTFSSPSGIAVDALGDIFVGDTGNDAVKEIVAVNGVIPPSPTINTLGSGFRDPGGVALDGLGNLYIADSGNNAVKEIPYSAGIYGSPVQLGGGFNGPEGVAVDRNGNVFVADTVAFDVKEMLAVNGEVPMMPEIISLGSGYIYPSDVAVDLSGNVYVADEFNDQIRELLSVNGIMPSSPVILTLGSGFYAPASVAVDSNGDVFVADNGNNALKEMIAVAGSIPPLPTILTLDNGIMSPTGVAVDAMGNLFYDGYYSTQISQLDYSDAPTLVFDATAIGVTSADSPQTVNIVNSGNENLLFPPPPTGNNPSISAGYTIRNSSTCPRLTATSAAGILPVGSSCTESVNFVPVAVGSNIGDLSISDNDLNLPGTTQQVPLSGIGISNVPVISFSIPNHTFGDPSFSAGASSKSSGSFAYSVISGPATVVGNIVSLTGAGTVVIQAIQAPDGIYTTGLQDATFRVAKESKGFVVNVPIAVFLDNPATLTATVVASAGVPTGMITFLDGSTDLGAVSLASGTGTLNLNNLPLGTHPIYAVYSGDSNFVGDSSSPSPMTVMDFSLVIVGNASVSVKHGQTAIYSLSLSPLGGNSTPSPILLTCSGYPQGSRITFSPQSVAPGSAGSSVEFTIQTPDYPTALLRTNEQAKTIRLQTAVIIGGFGLLLLSRSRRYLVLRVRSALLMLWMFVAVTTSIGVSGCGSGWRTENFNLTITGSAGQLTHVANLNLTVH